MIFFLVGCSSDSKYDELEKRVSYLENQLGMKYSDSDATGNNSSETINDVTETVEAAEETASDEAYSYVIDSLSDNDVVNECKYYFENVPSQGESFDDYYATLKVKPVKAYTDSGVDCQFYDISIDNEQTEHDVITSIRILGTQTEMDGSIGYSDDYYGVRVDMIIQDYSRASNIYSQLFDIVSTSGKFTEINDVRDSTNWYADAMFWTSDSGAIGVNLISMDKQDNEYNIRVTYYLRRE